MYSQLTARELAAWTASGTPPVLLDVRQPEEHELASIPGSILIPLGELQHRADELEPLRDRDIVVYCHHGIRSLNAIRFLRHIGFEKLWNLAGGIDRWSTEVDPKVTRY